MAGLCDDTLLNFEYQPQLIDLKGELARKNK